MIVDDGSTDGTPAILAEFAARFDFIEIVKRRDRGRRAVGPGVVEAFYDGLARINLADFDYVVKFDGDLELPPRYFERVMELMEADPSLGNLSGKLFERKADGSLFEERTGDENAVGPIKFYRSACFAAIGGFVREVGWDGIDGHVCRLNGWIAQSVHDPELRIIHLRPMGSSQENIVVGRVRWGRGKYFMGSAWYYVLAAGLYRSIEPPYALAGLAIAFGYFRALLCGHPRYENPGVPPLPAAIRAGTASARKATCVAARERANPTCSGGCRHCAHRLYQCTSRYLLNQYPYASATFIRREILALESLGFTISRFSIRPTEHALRDEADLVEAAKTAYVLRAPKWTLDRQHARGSRSRSRLRLPRAAFGLEVWPQVRRNAACSCTVAYMVEACTVLRWARQRGVEHIHAHFATNPVSVAMLLRVLGGPTYSFTRAWTDRVRSCVHSGAR